MRIIHKQNDEVRLLVENLDDLWYLYSIIDKDDIVSGKTVRKIKKSADQEGIRKTVFLTVRVEKAEFSAGSLRVLGVIVDAFEDIQKGAHHSFAVDIGDQLTIIKKDWLSYHWSRLKEACEQKRANILVVVFDREECLFARIKQQGFEVLAKLKGEVQKKGYDVKSNDFFGEIIKTIGEYDSRHNFEHIILASPSFWKDALLKLIKGEWKSKVVTAVVSSVDEAGVRESLTNDNTVNALKSASASLQLRAVDELLSSIAKNSKVVYGFNDVLGASGAIERLLVSNNFIDRMRSEGRMHELETIFKTVERSGKVMFISSEHEGGKKLDGLGGIAAFLRYNVTSKNEAIPQH
ncbi:mRNA surveillance protein pelota [Candidatus Woesearchaeota archaeon]|nr:mRNA surveillance protein pelota [Candidatus Woesearchaeota archaeon]